MATMSKDEGRYRVLLLGVGNNTDEGKEIFCKRVSESFGITGSRMRTIVDRCPLVLKRSLTLQKAESLAKSLKSLGAVVTVEEKRDVLEAFLEFQDLTPHRLALESAYLRKTESGAWNVIGRVRNISSEGLHDSWVLIQLLDSSDDILTFEEAPIAINPLPAGMASPFRVVFEGGLFIGKASIAFKTSSGEPVPTVDRRKKREWSRGKLEGESEPASSLISKSDERMASIREPDSTDEILLEEVLEPPAAPLPINTEEPEGKPEEGGAPIEQRAELAAQHSPALPLNGTPCDEGVDSPEKESPPPLVEVRDEGGLAGGGILEIVEPPPLQAEPTDLLEGDGLEDENLPLDLEGPPSGGSEDKASPDTRSSVLDEAVQLLDEISAKPTEGEPPSPPLPWLNEFRSSVETFYQNGKDPFSMWFEEQTKGGRLMDLRHALMAILIHARFDQTHEPENAIHNTETVYGLMVEPFPRLEDIPPLEGTEFFSRENWRYLFHRAIPRLQQVSKDIVEKKNWASADLERLIQIIPHMTPENSRKAVRRIHAFLPDGAVIDFSRSTVLIGEELYRVASRLGVVSPFFDTYRGKNSPGDLKIQTFAKTTFPDHPARIEDPMNWVGRREEGGNCSPAQPECKGCLFESFCPKLYHDFNPSEKGII